MMLQVQGDPLLVYEKNHTKKCIRGGEKINPACPQAPNNFAKFVTRN